MAKVLKVAAAVASIGALAIATGGLALFGSAAGVTLFGLGAGTFSAIALGASVGASLLAKKPQAPDASQANFDRLRANVDPRTPRKTAVGSTALATDIRDEEFTDDQEIFHRFIVCASHKVHAIREIWFDDEKAWSLTGGVTSKYAGYLQVTPVLEGSAANAINISPRMGSTRRYTGMAYVYLRYKLTGNSKKAESPFAQSIPTRITIRGDAALLPDPRNPAHDMADQSTWTWDPQACRNPALALLFYLLGYRINGRLVVGKGIPPERIDLDSFAVAANLCDELVDDGKGGTEPRYRCGGVWSEGDAPRTVMGSLKASMNADIDDVDGKLRLTVFHNDLAVPVAHFTDDDVLGSFDWDEGLELNEVSNVIRGVFTDPSDVSLYQPIDYPELREDSEDGIDRIDTFNLPYVESASQAQRLAGLRKARQKYGGGTFTAEFQATAWAVQKNDVVELTFRARRWTRKLFRVAEQELREDGVVPLVLREEDARIYGPPALRDPVDPVASTPYDPARSPVIRALGDAEQNLIATSSQSLVSIAATDTTITIGDHTRFYADKTVPVTGAALTGLEASTSYNLYYDDPARAGGAVAWEATTDFFAAQNSAENPARHFGGYITTDVAGGGGTTGGGSLPPGSGGGNPYERQIVQQQ